MSRRPFRTLLAEWTERRVEDLHRLVLEDEASPSEIAEEIGLSRAKVVRKIRELGLDQRSEPGEREEVAKATPFRSVRLPLRYAPHVAQRALHRKAGALGIRYVLAVAGRRGGKTQAGAAEFARRLVRDAERALLTRGRWAPAPGKAPKPWLRYLVVSPTYALINEPKMALQAYLGTQADGGLIIPGKQGDTEWWLVGGIRIDFRSGDRPERLVSHGYDGVWLDEAARLKPSVWAENVRATLSDTMGWALFTSTPLGRDWLYEQIWAKCDPEAAAEVAKKTGKSIEEILDPAFVGHTWTTAENTALPHLAEEMEQARRELPEEQFARNYLATWDVFPGQIFRLIPARHRVHLQPEASRYTALAAGLDIGDTHKTSVSLVGTMRTKEGIEREEIETEAQSGVDFDDSADWALRDTTGSMWTSRVYRMLKRWAGPYWQRVPLYLPADRPDVARQFQRRGFNVVAAYQQHEPALSWMQTAFHAGRLRVRSDVLYACLLKIRRPQPGERSTKAWVDKDDDEFDGFRYSLSEPIALGESPTGRSLPGMGWAAPR